MLGYVVVVAEYLPASHAVHDDATDVAANEPAAHDSGAADGDADIEGDADTLTNGQLLMPATTAVAHDMHDDEPASD